MAMGRKIFKTRKEYICYLRRRRQIVRIISIISVLPFLYIALSNSQSIDAWLIFVGYVSLIAILSYRAEQEFLKEDNESAEKKAQSRLARENKKRICKKM